MVNVRQCILGGTFPKSGTFTSALLDFLARQPLRELNVFLWNGIPAATIQGFLTIAPVISFSQSGVEENPRLLSDNPQHKPKVEDLFVDDAGPVRQVCDLIAQPQFKWYTSTLRLLSIPSLDNAAGMKLLVATAPTLEHLHLERIHGTVLPTHTPFAPLHPLLPYFFLQCEPSVLGPYFVHAYNEPAPHQPHHLV
ncbi:hypothetical protein B0H14DRAFT_1486253 [Mycena olivaceomarginata]|nr:hypothetical protein B0H14DRAFT_1486253 [Mycena olivaceomarginata]